MRTEFGFQELSEIFRSEMYSNPLADVRKDLYKAMAGLLDDLKRECLSLERADPDSLMLIRARDLRRQAEAMVKSIIVCRARKVCLRALRAADGMDMQQDRLTLEEQRYYEEVLAANRRQLGIVTDYMRQMRLEIATDGEPSDTIQDEQAHVSLLKDIPDPSASDCTYTLSERAPLSFELRSSAANITKGLLR